MEFDVSDTRERFKTVYKTSDIDKTYYFFYDETGNIRKLHVKDQKFNVLLNNYFILGGFVLCSKPENSESLKEELGTYLILPEEELESAFICTRDKNFLNTLKQRKLHAFLRFCMDKGFCIHMQCFNFLYWSLVDIIDSIKGNEFELENNKIFKNLLYMVCKENIASLLAFFQKYSYPNLSEQQSDEFLSELIEKIVQDATSISFFDRVMLTYYLSKGKGQKLTFISDNKTGVIIEDLFTQYLDNVEKYIYSEHIFDEEKTIQKILKHTNYTIKNKSDVIQNFFFVNSKDSFYLQIADVIVGIVYRLKKYLLNNDVEKIESDLITLSSIQRENLKMLLELIDKSQKKSMFFIHNIDAIEEINKLAYLMDRILIN